MIDLYAAATANGQKAALMLEETGCEYILKPVDLTAGEHKTPAFLAINPVGKIPAIVDPDGADGGLAVFETLGIALYLCEKTGTLMPATPAARARAYVWAAVAATDLTPALSAIFVLNANVPDTSGPSREFFHGEADRFFRALDGRLAEAEYLAGDYSFADTLAYPTAVTSGQRMASGLEPYPNVRRWSEAVAARPAIQRGMQAIQAIA